MEGGYHILLNTQSDVRPPFSGVNLPKCPMEAGFELQRQLEGGARQAIRRLVRLRLLAMIPMTRTTAAVRTTLPRPAQHLFCRILALGHPDVANRSTKSLIRRNVVNGSTRMIDVE